MRQDNECLNYLNYPLENPVSSISTAHPYQVFIDIVAYIYGLL